MTAPVLVPSLAALRSEFDCAYPGRSTASDGWIGDTSHQGSNSDHNPDDTPGLSTPGSDADHVPEVHAIDVTANLTPYSDSSSGKPDPDMEREIQGIIARCRAGKETRLQNVIYFDRIWSRSSGWVQKPYSGANNHRKHAHLSSTYETKHESDTSPWGIEGTDMQLSDKFVLSDDACDALGKPRGTEVTVETAYELMLIHVGRESREHYERTQQELAAQNAKIDQILAAVTATPPPPAPAGGKTASK